MTFLIFGCIVNAADVACPDESDQTCMLLAISVQLDEAMLTLACKQVLYSSASQHQLKGCQQLHKKLLQIPDMPPSFCVHVLLIIVQLTSSPACEIISSGTTDRHPCLILCLVGLRNLLS